MPAELEKTLDRPTPFTKQGVRILRYANKGRLETVIGFMDAQAKLHAPADRRRHPHAGPGGLRLPAAIKVNRFGNIPAD